MVRTPRLAALALAGALSAWLPAAAHAQQGGRAERPQPPLPTLLGNWRTADGNGVIAIEPCGQALCGRIVGITRAPGEKMPTDVHGTSQCGLTIIRHEHPDDDGAWLGDITDPRDGSVYHAKIWMGEDGNLRLRGYLGLPLFGQTQTWHRFTGQIGDACAFV